MKLNDNRRIVLVPLGWRPEAPAELEAVRGAMLESLGAILGRGTAREIFVYCAQDPQAIARTCPGAAIWHYQRTGEAWSIVVGSVTCFSWESAWEAQKRLCHPKPRHP